MEAAQRNGPAQGNLRKNDEHIATRILNAVFILAEVLVLLVKIKLSLLQAVWETIVPPTERSVSGEIVLITGTGHGIGKELARQYGTLGATVVCVDINEQNNNATVEEVKRNGGKAHGFKCDISKRENVLALAEQVKRDIGDVTILVNNAGIMPTKRFENHTPEDIHRIFDINVFAHYWTLEAFLPTMKENNYGHVVALSSMAGVCGLPNIVPYCASKFAVRGLMEALEEEYRQAGRNVNFTAIYPYMVDTNLCKKPKIRFESFMKMLPPADVAAAIISAQRKNIRETSVPSYMLGLNNYVRTLPNACAMHIIDFFQSGVDPADD